MSLLRTILVIDDEAALRDMLRLVLEREGYTVHEAESAEDGLALLDPLAIDAVLCDIRMPGMGGHGFLRGVLARPVPPTVIMMSAYGTIDTAIACMKEGAYDYVAKPFKPDEVVLTLRKAEERLSLRRENLQLRDELARRDGERRLVWSSAAMAQVDELIRRAAPAAVPVLICGETGTGKELVARALHRDGPRGSGPFIVVNCGAIPAGLVESELFGHARGAYTGADRERTGLFEAANGGTLFLDEIGELPLELQPKLLRVLQEGEIQRVGENRTRRVEVRVVAASGRDLRAAVAAGHFRSDLFYRLAVIEINLPPLRERRDDIPLIVAALLERIASRDHRPRPSLVPAALRRLQQHDWPGNVRELENLLEKTLLFCRGERIEVADLALGDRSLPAAAPAAVPAPSPPDAPSPGDPTLATAVARAEAAAIRAALAASDGNRTQAAQRLAISLRSLMYKIKEHGLD